ncbi:FAD-binding oxidoreductase [Streptomyces sp. NBC_01485]|uniref:NAD(P)/FAD-dependent oxidoreductase n=1 Tax=Streptomyces sp. NBC_01485 TaxID=2903884 RepID=UPI002E36B408|nr:FAD-dependent oxidoreductase [Streptomyces sp. NBC_01485]
MKHVDVLIMGNGVLGLLLADELAGRGDRSVAVVGPRRRERGASQAAGAMLGCFAEVTTDTLSTAPGRARFETALSAHGRWPGLLRRLEATSRTSNPPHGTRPSPPIRVATDTHVLLNTSGSALDSANFAAMLDALVSHQADWAEVDPATIPGYNPRPHRRALRAVRLAGEGAVDSRRVLDTLAVQVEQSGVLLVDGTVSELLTAQADVCGVRLADGRTIEAGTVVAAAGADSRALAEDLLAPPEMMPMFAGRGLAVVGQRTLGHPFDSVVRTPNRAFACGLHVVPLGGGREYLGATNSLVPSTARNPALFDVQFLIDSAMRQLDEGIAHHDVAEWRTGHRPVSLDGFPLVGWSTRPGLYFMTGTYRDGFHTGPVLAEHAANELEGKPGILDPMFSPTRLPIRTRTVEESVAAYVKHSLAAWFETGTEVAAHVPTATLATMFANRATALYDRLGIDYGLPPEVVAYALYQPAHAAGISAYFTAIGQ